MIQTTKAITLAICFTLPALAADITPFSTVDTNSTVSSSCPSTNSTTTCSAAKSTCNTKASNSNCSSSLQKNEKRSEAADQALLDITNSNLEQSRKLLDMSDNLLLASENIENIEDINSEYIDAMLHLADNINVMSERIAKNADKVIEMDDQNNNDLERAVSVADMILDNNTKIQQNLLEAQKIFNDKLISLNK